MDNMSFSYGLILVVVRVAGVVLSVDHKLRYGDLIASMIEVHLDILGRSRNVSGD